MVMAAKRRGDQMEVIYIGLVLIVAILLILAMRKTFSSPGTLGFNGGNVVRKSKKNSPVARNPYRATSIVFGVNACDAVKAVGSRRFLDTERNLPVVPLPGCSVAECNCKYAHYQERRISDEDQRLPSALLSQLYESTGKENRRQRKRGRRKSDWT
jgi:hypothetical protein